MKFPRSIVALIISLSAIGLFTGMAGSRTGVTYLCAQRISEVDRIIGFAIDSMEPWRRNRGDGRAIASLRDPGPMLELLPPDRKSWQDWAEQRLAETQKYKDAVDRVPSARVAGKELGKLMNDLVGFHGYASLGNARRMITMLQQMRDRNHAVRLQLCK